MQTICRCCHGTPPRPPERHCISRNNVSYNIIRRAEAVRASCCVETCSWTTEARPRTLEGRWEVVVLSTSTQFVGLSCGHLTLGSSVAAAIYRVRTYVFSRAQPNTRERVRHREAPGLKGVVGGQSAETGRRAVGQ